MLRWFVNNWDLVLFLHGISSLGGGLTFMYLMLDKDLFATWTILLILLVYVLTHGALWCGLDWAERRVEKNDRQKRGGRVDAD